MTRESIIVALGLASAAVAIGAAVASLLDFDALRRFADGLAPDGDVEVLARATDAQALAALRALAVVAALAAAMLLALRRGFFLASPPTRPAHAGNAKASAFALTIAGLVFVVGIALAWRNLATPVRVDEANAVLRFSSQSLWTVLSHYDSPQNHILHTLLVYVAHRLGGWEVVALRLPAFLAAILVLPAAWCFMRREHGRFAASLATALIATSPLFIEYAANARGHSLMTLFFLLSLLCAQRLLRQSDATGCWALFALCIALGLFTIPIMAFPAAVAVAWMLVVRWRQAGAAAMLPFAARTAAWSGAALALALILYAPVLAVSGYDALFQHKYAERTGVSWLDGPRLLQLAWNLTAVTWTNWHAATPVWAQATLATLVAIGAVAPRRPTGHRGTFPLAVVLGLGAMLAAKPMLLEIRFTIFLLCASMMIAGAGGAWLVDAALTRFRASAIVRDATRGLAVSAALVCFGWWATRPGVAEWFRWETGWSPSAPALAANIAPLLRPGDVLGFQISPLAGVRFYLHAAGHRLTRIHRQRQHGTGACAPALPVAAEFRRAKAVCDLDALACLPQSGNPWWAFRVDGQDGSSTASDAPGHLFLVVDDIAHDLASSRERRLGHPAVNSHAMQRHIEERGYDHRTIDLSVGKIYRLTLAQWNECRLQ